VTRPDARLLVPVASLPGGRAPEGSRVWKGGHYLTWRRDLTLTGGEHLDLSRPDVVDGVPVRLDALAWALGVLCFGAAWVRTNDHQRRHALMTKVGGVAGYIVERGTGRQSHMEIVIGDRWPDVAGLSEVEASRAVVAAALRGGA
jgi:hypothetical protein